MVEDPEVEALRAEVARLRAELRNSQALHQATVESLPFDFWARDRAGYAVSQNSATLANWGNLLDRRPQDMDLPPDVIAMWLANNERALAGEIVRGDVDYVIDGETRHIRNILAPIRQGDEIVGTLGVNIDLTELRRAEAERLRLERRLRETQRLETLGLLAGGVAHDINNIVMVILGMTSLARRATTLGSRLESDLATIDTACRRAAAICNQLLTFAGKGQIAVELLDLGGLVTETATLVRSSLPPSIEVRGLAPAQPPVVVSVDATQIRQLVMNLILNASDAIGDRAGTITVRVEAADPALVVELARGPLGTALDPARPYALLAVTDTGSGMTAETRGRIFEPFFTTKARGRGLGLAAALGTVRGHGGALDVESAPGAGATFRVLLPRSGHVATELAPVPTPSDWRGTGTALIVDDDDQVARAAARMVEALGFTTIVAGGGEDALDVLRDHPDVALVLLDLMMPGLDGRTTFDRIREQSPTMPVVLMSGFHDLAEPPLQTPLLRKPFTLAELARLVRDAIDAARART